MLITGGGMKIIARRSYEHIMLIPMAKQPPLDQLRSAFRSIRERADHALDLLKETDELRCLSWRCLVCGHVKKFTRPVPREVAIPCPKCKGTDFAAD
jgi:rubrerythrin